MSTIKQATALSPDIRQTPTGEVCIPNISTRERLGRLAGGGIAFVFALAAFVALTAIEANHWWRLLLLLPFAGATTGFFQWLDKTCVGLSARQSRRLGDRMEKIEDAAELAQVRRQAKRVEIKALLAAIVLTLIALVLP
jgi:hypothetical protein